MTHFKKPATRTLLTCLVAAVANTCLAGNRAQPSQLSDQQTYAASTHLYTYHYTLANPAGRAAPLPLSGAGKILKRELRQAALQRLDMAVGE